MERLLLANVFRFAKFCQPRRAWPTSLLLAGLLATQALQAEPVTGSDLVPVQFATQMQTANNQQLARLQGPASEWWRDFSDQELDQLIRQALQANPDLQIASARLQQAQALWQGADADYKPQLQAGAELKGMRDPTSTPMSHSRSLGLRASWELDIFARGKALMSAAEADAAGQRYALELTQLMLAADVASAYYEIRMLVQRQQLLDQAINLAQRQFEVAERKFAAGSSTALDADRWRSELAQERANLAQLRSQQQVRMRQLAILLGQRELPALSGLNTTISNALTTQFPATPANKLDASLIERRPDVQRQARALDAALARAGLARRDLYPNLSFSWSGSRDRLQSGSDASVSGFSLGYGLTLSLPILDGGRIRTNIAIHDARVQEAQADYDKALLAALVDVDSCWQQATDSIEIYQQWLKASQASELAANRAERLYQAGASDVSAVLDARRADLKARDALVQASAARWQTAIALRRAFAGAPV